MEAGIGAELDLALGTAVPTFTGQPSDPPVRGRFTVRALSDGRCTLKGPMMTGVSVNLLGPSACLEIDGIQVAVVGGKKQLLDRELLRMVGITAEADAHHRGQEQQPLPRRLHAHRQPRAGGQGRRADGRRPG
jgi:microcystin degradation protein MlrC